MSDVNSDNENEQKKNEKRIFYHRYDIRCSGFYQFYQWYNNKCLNRIVGKQCACDQLRIERQQKKTDTQLQNSFFCSFLERAFHLREGKTTELKKRIENGFVLRIISRDPSFHLRAFFYLKNHLNLPNFDCEIFFCFK